MDAMYALHRRNTAADEPPQGYPKGKWVVAAARSSRGLMEHMFHDMMDRAGIRETVALGGAPLRFAAATSIPDGGGRPRCQVHDVPIHIPESWDEEQEPYCPICHVREGERAGAWTVQALERRGAIARALIDNFGKDIWCDPEFVDTWRFYQAMAIDMPQADPTFLAGMLGGIWTLRNIKRETMEARNMRRRVKESMRGVHRAVEIVGQRTNLEPELGSGS